jgi:hypothetical protein
MFGTLPAYGLYCRHVDGLTLRDVEVRWADEDHRPVLVCDDVTDLQVIGLKGQLLPADRLPLVTLHDVTDATFRGCQPPADARTFLQLTGATDRINVISCDLTRVRPAYTSGPDVPKNAVRFAGNIRPGSTPK